MLHINKEAVEKSKNPKVDSLKEWLEGKMYWEQYLWQLHLTKEALSDADINKCYQYILEDFNVIKEAPDRTVIAFQALNLEGAEKPKNKVTLDKIEKLRNVNAIDDSCIIEFCKKLTIIYGDNGSGKSGIGRLLSNACNSRKPRKLLPNARTDASSGITKAKATLHVSGTFGSREINYTVGDIDAALKSFSVFDHECALIHLNSENKVDFVPSKIQIFDEVFKSISALETKLQEESKARASANPTEGVFIGTSSVTEFLASLSHLTTDEQINDALKFTVIDKELLTQKTTVLLEKQKQDVSERKKELADECNVLNTFKTTLLTMGVTLSVAKAEEINAQICAINEKKKIADKLSVKNFAFSDFNHIGSLEWKALITAAQKLYEKETVSKEGAVLEHCLLCRQGLAKKEKVLFDEYWKFLKSTAEEELATARQTLSASLAELERVSCSWPVFSDTEVAVKILKRDAGPSLTKIQDGFIALFTQLIEWIKNVKNEHEVVFVVAKINLDPITTLVKQKNDIVAKLSDPISEIKSLNEAIAYLMHKQQASNILTKIIDYVAWLRWQNLVSKIQFPTIRGNTTRKKTEIMEEMVISRYIEIFNRETEKLDCNFGLKVKSHGHDAETHKELELGFARGYSPSEILSEGEQTVSALADFLTEAMLDKTNSGIIFDDPVCSLDHLRKTVIAKRLVEEAKERQVIVLTHDIVFLLDLQFYADAESLEHRSLSMRRIGDNVGLIKPELPWIALNVGKKVGYLKNELGALKKAETGDSDEYRKMVKLWYMLLREAWERAVEERLFKGVVQRFNKGVMTLKLPKVEVNPALIKEITDGMSESSKWLHDMAVGMNPAVPKSANLAAELASLEGFISKVKPD
ncbi:MAG: AAA family ATPase [Candidatus Margulisiibacteriota bacterium]